MNEEQSIIKKTESALDDLLDLWHRRKLVCIIVLAVIVLPAGFTLYQQFVAVPKLKDQIATLETQKREAEEKHDKAEESAKRDRKASEKLERQQDSIRKFMVNYRAHLWALKNDFSQLRRARAHHTDFSPEEIKKLEDQLIDQVMTFTKFLNEWRVVHQALRPLLNGDANALTAAAKARNVTEMEKRSELLERNIDDKQRVLEEAARALQ